MKLWILRPVENLDNENNPWRYGKYDAYYGFVMRAETEEIARQLAADVACAENNRFGNPWINNMYTTCYELTSDGAVGIVLSDYNAG